MSMLESVFMFVQKALLEPVIIIGLLVMVGYILQKKTAVQVITGTVSAMVGLHLIIFGGSQFTDTFKPIVETVNDHHGITGYLMDPYAMRATTQELLGNKFAYVGYVFVIAFLVNMVLVYFGKHTKARGMFLTGNTGIAHSQAVLWLVIYLFGLNDLYSVLLSGLLLGLFWAYGTTSPIDTIDKVTDGAGFTIGHNQMFGIWFFGKFADKFGDPEKEDADNLKLPGWLAIFNHNTTSIAIIMALFTGGFLLTTGIDNVQELAGGQHWLIYIINLGLRFSMYMTILLTGVRMLVGELNQSFVGIQQKFLPEAVPAVDVAALLPYSPNGATIGFIFTTLGTVFSMFILYLIKSPIMVIPGFVPLFFAGGPIGVVANKLGGYKSSMICGFLLGIIQSFGTVWAISVSGISEGIGWTGMFDWATIIPFFTHIAKLVFK